jgi:hypothetical protein
MINMKTWDTDACSSKYANTKENSHRTAVALAGLLSLSCASKYGLSHQVHTSALYNHVIHHVS